MDGAWESAQGRLERVQRGKPPPPPGIEARVLDSRQDLVTCALVSKRARRITPVESLRAMMLDLLAAMLRRRFFVAALSRRWAILFG